MAIDVTKLIDLLIDFQAVERNIQIPKLSRPENDTEHSYNLAMAAWVIITQDNLPLNLDLVWMKQQYPNRKFFVIGSSYGGFLATQLTKYRKFDGLILRAPAIYKPSEFYTLMKNEDRDGTQAFRRNADALAKHPLLARASQFEGNVLLVVHENDEQIPRETTDAYANAFKPETIFVEGVTHSLDNVTEQQVADYNQKIFDWLGRYTTQDGK